MATSRRKGTLEFRDRAGNESGCVARKDHDPVQILGPGVFPSLDEEMLRQLLLDRAPWFKANYNFVYWRMLVRFERRLAPIFGRGRVWLAGDAGHLTGPAGIQSMNVGLREARDVAGGIVATEKEGNGEALRVYSEARRSEWQRLLGMTGSVAATNDAAPEIAAQAQELLACLPASGDVLGMLAERLGLRLVS